MSPFLTDNLNRVSLCMSNAPAATAEFIVGVVGIVDVAGVSGIVTDHASTMKQ